MKKIIKFLFGERTSKKNIHRLFERNLCVRSIERYKTPVNKVEITWAVFDQTMRDYPIQITNEYDSMEKANEACSFIKNHPNAIIC